MESKQKAGWAIPSNEIVWEDRSRVCGLPITFIKYQLTSERLIISQGLLNLSGQQIQLYRMKDFSIKQSLMDRLFGVGDILIISSDPQCPQFLIRKIKNPWQVLELFNEAVQIAYTESGVRPSEIYVSR